MMPGTHRYIGQVSLLAAITRVLACAAVLPAALHAQETAETPPVPAEDTYYIQEYRVEGNKLLTNLEIEKAVYPYMGPGRVVDDVNQARAALEQAYKAKGYQTVVVEIPEQQVAGGLVRLKVVEMPIGRLRVNNSRFYRPSRIRKKARSMAPGSVPNWSDVQRDIVALNRTADLRVTPSLGEGVIPGTVDVDLNVEDAFPLHGSLELNNRYTQDTTELRLNGAVNYGNLWQAGHTVGLSFQVAPERPEDATVLSAYYLAPVPSVEGLALFLQGTLQDSDVSTLAGTGVVGRGEVVSGRAMFTLPGKEGFYHSLSVGLDYKHFEEDVTLLGTVFETPITYYPLSLLYSGSWVGKKYETELNAGINWHFRGVGADQVEFDNKRFNADGGWIYLRGDVSHQHTLPADFQVFGKVQGQLADTPLINSEQYSGGGLSNNRGYLESTALGDNGLFATFELRSPFIFGAGEGKPSEWRIYAFADAGFLTLNDPLPEQDDRFKLVSIGAGTYLRLFDHLNASLDLGVPLMDVAAATSGDALLTFRVWAEF